GRRVRPWLGGRRPKPAPPTRALKRAAAVLALAVTLASIVVVINGRWGVFWKMEGGWYAAAWHGNIAVGRSSTPFQETGWEIQRYDRFRLSFGGDSALMNTVAVVPLWLPVPLFLVIGVVGAWRLAVRRGLGRHWSDGVTAER